MNETNHSSSGKNLVSGLSYGPFSVVRLVVATIAIFAMATILMYQWTYANHIFLGVKAAGLDLGGYTREEAQAALIAHFDRYARIPITLSYGAKRWETTPAELGFRFDVERTVQDAYSVGRSGDPLSRLLAQLDALRFGRTVIQPAISFNKMAQKAYLASLAEQIDQPTINASLTIQPDLSVKVTPAQAGRKLNIDKMAKIIEESLLSLSPQNIELVVEENPPSLVESDLAEAKGLAEKILSTPLQLRFRNQTWTIERKEVASWLLFRERKEDGQVKGLTVELDEIRLRKLAENLAKEINREPVDARLAFNKGRLSVIREGADGLRLDVAATVKEIKAQAPSDNHTLELPVTVIRPKIASEDKDRLGIKELILETSTEYGFPGALAERNYNIELAASRLNGIVLAPGDVFSFNKEVGEVSKRTGYKVGYAITQQDGNAITVPSEGGGICQVATTLFHTVFWAGYPVVERSWHFYWIPRYGWPPHGLKGLDATIDQTYDKNGNLVYALDFKFKNNTGNYVLVQSWTDGKNLAFALYGVKPNWEVRVEEPKIENVVKADTNLIEQPDPTLPEGKKIYVEHAEDGFKATIVRTVLQGGRVVDKHTFVSEYRPSRNVVLVGTKKP